MAVTKYNGYAAPYRSQTFRDEANAIISRNGILAISGNISTVSGNVIIPPFTLSQQGLLYVSDEDTSVVLPSLQAPYFITVSAVTPVQVDDLTFQFATRPEDLTDTQVILGMWDGTGWRLPPLVSVDGLISQAQQTLVDLNQVGPESGLITTIVGSNYSNSPGVLVDRQGVLTSLDGTFTTPKIATDPDWDRVDRLVFRRPIDYANRIGARELTIGGTYSAAAQTLYETALTSATLVHQSPLTLVAPDNTVHFLYVEGYGSALTIKYQKYDSTRQTQLIAATTIVSTTSPNFSATVDSSGNIHLAYTASGVLTWTKLSSVGAALAGPVAVDSRATPSDFPQVTLDPYNQKVFFIYQNLIGAGDNQILFATLTLGGITITAPVQLTASANNLIHPSIFVTTDLQAFIAYEDNTAGIIYYMVTDDIGAIDSAPVAVSASTSSTSYGTLVNQASYPTVKVSDNDTLFIAFMQKKTISLVGIAVYTGGSAYLQDLTSSGENILDYDIAIDSSNNDVNIIASQSGRLDFVKLNDTDVILSVSLSGSGAGGASLQKDIYGSLVHSWVNALPGTYSNVGGAEQISNIGPVAVAGSINTLVLSSSQFSLPQANAAYVPVVGDQVTMSGSVDGNNVTRLITSVSLQSINTTNDTYVITVSISYPHEESPAVAVYSQYAAPNGNEVQFIKSVGELSLARGLSTTVLPTDVLLTRCVFPGPSLLNYIPDNTPGVNSDIYGMYGAINVDWSATTANALTMTTGLSIVDLVQNINYTVAGGTFALSNGEALYVVLDGVDTSITPQIGIIGSLPWGTPIQVLGFVQGGEFYPHLFSIAGMGELEVGESIVLGQEISNNLKVRLGVINDITYENYTSTTVVSPTASYPEAISDLDAAINTIVTETPQEEYFISAGQTTFTLSIITFSAMHSIPDIVVRRGGQALKQSPDGNPSNGDFIKVGTTQIQFSYTVPATAQITVRKERTGGVGGSVDLTNIPVDIQPDTNGDHALGTVTKAWNALYLKDTMSAQVYQITMVSGVLTVTAVP